MTSPTMPNKNHARITKMTAILQQALEPDHLEIIDDSHKHRGHAGAQSGAGHFTLIISSKEFSGKTRLDCHRRINNLLKDLFTTDIHALCIKILNNNTPAT